jgi:hypothetical protein
MTVMAEGSVGHELIELILNMAKAALQVWINKRQHS